MTPGHVPEAPPVRRVTSPLQDDLAPAAKRIAVDEIDLQGQVGTAHLLQDVGHERPIGSLLPVDGERHQPIHDVGLQVTTESGPLAEEGAIDSGDPGLVHDQVGQITSYEGGCRLVQRCRLSKSGVSPEQTVHAALRLHAAQIAELG